jgi:hypothetical protein
MALSTSAFEREDVSTDQEKMHGALIYNYRKWKHAAGRGYR